MVAKKKKNAHWKTYLESCIKDDDACNAENDVQFVPLNEEIADSSPLQDEQLHTAMYKKRIAAMLATLKTREEFVLRHHFGINEEEKTLRAIGNLLGLSPERIRQIEKMALKKLLHPNRAYPLRDKVSYDPFPPGSPDKYKVILACKYVSNTTHRVVYTDDFNIATVAKKETFRTLYHVIYSEEYSSLLLKDGQYFRSITKKTTTETYKNIDDAKYAIMLDGCIHARTYNLRIVEDDSQNNIQFMGYDEDSQATRPNSVTTYKRINKRHNRMVRDLRRYFP